MPSVTTQFPASVDVSTLNGINGFVINGITAYDESGAVSSAGDVNADGIEDLIIGAGRAASGSGVSYVIFGKAGIGNSGSIELSSLNGVDGFAINGALASSESGTSVSSAGDVNGDGIADLLIGGYNGSPGGISHAGITYVVFGKSGIGSSGSLDLSTLNGSNGFSITGSVANEQTGESVSSAGDVNHDGIADILIGAYTASPNSIVDAGKTYVVFGKLGIGSTGTISLSSLNGSNGFVINGNLFAEFSGIAVSAAGDVNHDGVADLMIGADYATAYNKALAGAVYIVFGKSGIGASGVLDLSTLNGINGFINYGVASDDQTGRAVSTAGDVNNDGIADFMIGGLASSPASGISYVVFGRSGIGGKGIFNLTSLNGVNGFVIHGTSQNQIGNSISYCRDVNGDKIADLHIGVPGGVTRAGSSYIIFGKSGIGSSSGSIDVLSLNGMNGFAINGIAVGDQFGSSVNSVDINGDGLTDAVIGAFGASPGGRTSAGITYVIFGDSPTTSLLKNRLNITIGQSIALSTANLNATSLTAPKNNGALIFSITNPQHGYFALSTNPVQAINTFNLQQIENGQIEFVHDGSELAPSYNVSVSDGRIAAIIPPQAAVVTFFHRGPALVNNVLSINQGQALILTSNQISGVDQDFPSKNPTLVFIVSSLQHGKFVLLTNPGNAIASFSQNQVAGGQVLFVHDGSAFAPSYNVSVSVGGMTISPKSATVNFYLSPIISNNNLSIGQGQTILLSLANLSATDPNISADSLTFTITNIQHGSFQLVSDPGSPIVSFTQAQIENGDIQFVHDGSTQQPSYSVSVSNGRTSNPGGARSANIAFLQAPILLTNSLAVNNGQTVILNSGYLSASDINGVSSSLIFSILNLQHGHFTFANFTQGQLQSGVIQFIHDGSNIAPSYSVLVSDGAITNPDGPLPAVITFYHSPILVTNQLAISQGQSVTLTATDLSATDPDVSPDNLIFITSNVQHGYFRDITAINTAIVTFKQQRITSAAIQFVADGSDNSPGYDIAVSDGMLSTVPAAAKISFVPENVVTISIGNDSTVRNAIIGGTVSGGIGLLFFLAKIIMSRMAARNLKRILTTGQTEVEKQQIEFYKEITRPIAVKIFTLISTTGCFGYRTDKETRLYIAAIESIIGKLADLGIDLNFKEIDPAKRTALITEIAKQTKKLTVPDRSLCSLATIGSFFKPDATPDQIDEQAEAIAIAVNAELGDTFKTSARKSQSSGKPIVQSYSLEVVSLFAERIFKRLKIAGLCDCCCIKEDSYIDAVETILNELAALKINLDFSSLSDNQTQQLLNETAHQVALLLKPKRNCVTKVASFFKLIGEFTPKQLESHAKEIAQAVKAALPTTFVNEKGEGSSKQVLFADKESIEMSEIIILSQT